MATIPSVLLRKLEATRLDYGPGRAAVKLALLRALARARLRTSGEVLRLHEHLCFLRAYPDDRAVLAQVERMLDGFARRSDLRRHRDALVGSGIAGTDIRYRFFWPTARWLGARWPDRLAIDWDNVDEPEKLAGALPLLVSPVEAIWLRLRAPEPKKALGRLRGPRTTDGAFYVRRAEAMPGDDFTREAFFDGLDTPLVLHPGQDTPSRTRARYPRSPVVFRAEAPRRGRPDLAGELGRPPRSVHPVSPREGRRLIDLAQEAMVTRARDLDAFAYGDAGDVRIADDGDGLQWAVIGMLPERRPLLRTAYGLLTLRNGVPLGYVQSDALFGCVDVAYNTFETFRGSEAAVVCARLLATLRHLFGARSFTFEPYQLGHKNDEGLASGAWWFYYRLGFRPRNPAIAAIARAEIARMNASPRHRSTEKTLAQLAEDYLYLETEGARAPYWPRLNELGATVTAHLASLAGADREAAVRECLRCALRLLGVAPLRGAGAHARAAWERWAPVVAVLPGLDRWSEDEKSALARIIFAKGGRRDSDYLTLFDSHPRLGQALRRLTGA
jgi:hypothetical protein